MKLKKKLMMTLKILKNCKNYKKFIFNLLKFNINEDMKNKIEKLLIDKLQKKKEKEKLKRQRFLAYYKKNILIKIYLFLISLNNILIVKENNGMN